MQRVISDGRKALWFVGTGLMTKTYLKSFWPQTSPFSSIGRDLLRHIQWWPHDLVMTMTMTYLKVDSLNGCSRLTLTMLINSSKVNTREGKSWSGGSEELETHCSSNWIFFLDKCIFNSPATGSWFLETWRRSHGFGVAPLYRAQMGKGLAQERQPEIDNMSF